MNATFKKEERLSSKKAIETLFSQGRNVKVYPFLVHFLEVDPWEGEYPARIIISARKRNHKHAVARNLIKRRMREAYRTHKSILYNPLRDAGKYLHVSLVYIDNEIKPFAEIDKKMQVVLRKLAERYTENPPT